MTGYVYVMDRYLNGLKIGRSVDPFRRLKELSNQNARAVLAMIMHRKESAVESAAHKILSAYRLKGEWFDVSLPDAIRAIAEAVIVVDAASPATALVRLPPEQQDNERPFYLGYLRETGHVSVEEQEDWLLASGVDALDIWRGHEIDGALKDCRDGDKFLVWSRNIFPSPRQTIATIWDRGASLVMKNRP